MIAQTSLGFRILILTQKLMTAHFFAQVHIEIIEKGAKAHISKSSLQDLLLEKQHFECTGTNGYQK